MEFDSYGDEQHIGDNQTRERRRCDLRTFFPFPGWNSDFYVGIFHRPDCETRAELISASGCVRRKFMADADACGSKPSAFLLADNFVVCRERLNQVRELNGKETAEVEKRREREEGEERAKEPIIRENTAGCHSQNLPESDDRMARFAIYIIFFPSWRLLGGETASPFRDFMINLFDDRRTIYNSRTRWPSR